MSEGRLTGLALLHIHRDIPVSAQPCHWHICEKERKRFQDFVIWNTSQPLSHSCNKTAANDSYATALFGRAMLCVSAAMAVMRCLFACLSVFPSVCHVRGSCQNE